MELKRKPSWTSNMLKDELRTSNVQHNAINLRKIGLLMPSLRQMLGPQELEMHGFLLPDRVEDRFRRNDAQCFHIRAEA